MLLKRIIQQRLSEKVTDIAPLTGGDINQVYLINCVDKRYVVKHNSRTRFPEMFELEVQGLKALSKCGARTPAVIDHFESDKEQFLILEYIEQEAAKSEFWVHFSHDLSTLHQSSNTFFGLRQDNYIGSLIQANDPMPSWESFFIEKRLQPLTRIAFDKRLLSTRHLSDFERLYKMFSKLIPVEPPAMLHGDLWSGNLLCASGQQAVFIDPAVYFGHREVDIAMTQMFGGFGRQFIEAYNERFALQNDWEQRIPIHNLYPQLVHLILFGHSYLSGIEQVLKRFS